MFNIAHHLLDFARSNRILEIGADDSDDQVGGLVGRENVVDQDHANVDRGHAIPNRIVVGVADEEAQRGDAKPGHIFDFPLLSSPDAEPRGLTTA